MRNKKNDSVSFFSCAKRTDHSLSLQGFRNKSELTTIFAQIMVTRGEWALKDLNVTPCNTSEKCEDYVRYEVKEAHFLPHVRPSLVFSLSSHPVTTTERLTQLHFKEQQLESIIKLNDFDQNLYERLFNTEVTKMFCQCKEEKVQESQSKMSSEK